MIDPSTFITIARAAGETNRLRMLWLCRDRRVAVSEFAQVLGISEPSVSRHIKLLEEAQLVRRTRQGQRVYFKVVGEGGLADVAAALLDQLDPASQDLRIDEQRLLALRGRADARSSPPTRLGRALAAYAALQLRSGWLPQRVDILRLHHPELLAPLLSPARPMQLTVGAGEDRLPLRRLLLAQEIDANQVRISERSALRGMPSAELILADCSDANVDVVEGVLAQASLLLGTSGTLWLFASYELLESGGEHPLLHLRRLLARAGLHSDTVQPVEADGAHVLFSVARPDKQSLRNAAPEFAEAANGR